MREQFKELRKKRNMSQAELEKATSSAAGTVSKFELGESNPTFETLEKWLSVLNCKLTIMENKTEIQILADKAKAMKAKKNVFKKAILKISEIEKAKDLQGLEDENFAPQIAGILMYEEKCEGTTEIMSFVNELIEYYKANKEQLTNRLRKHDFFNEFEFVFSSLHN